MTDQEIKDYLNHKIGTPLSEKERLIGMIMGKWVRDRYEEKLTRMSRLEEFRVCNNCGCSV